MDAITLYNDIWSSTDELEARSGESLHPRSSDILFDYFASFGPDAQSVVLDVGCRDAKYAVELARRFGCQVLAIDPAPRHIELAQAKIAETGLAGQVRAELGRIEAIPAPDNSVDPHLVPRCAQPRRSRKRAGGMRPRPQTGRPDAGLSDLRHAADGGA